LKFGTDIYSRYVWRGINLGGESPAFQPSITYTTGGLMFGTWGSYSFPGSTIPYSENDLMGVYTNHNFSIYLTDYYVTSTGIPFSHYNTNFGVNSSHLLEIGIGYTGSDNFPLSVCAYYDFYGDPYNSEYAQISYPFNIDSTTTLTLALGIVPAKSIFYNTMKTPITNISVVITKSLIISKELSIPINVSYIVNPNMDITYIVFGMSIGF